jgi:hypothetical protein
MRWLLILTFFLFSAGSAPRATVYVFLAPTCPISQAVMPAVRALHAQYGAAHGVAFVGVFPEAALTATDRARFGRDYQLSFPLQADAGHVLTHRLGATVTPEAVLTDAAGALLYRGRIDDSYARLGVRRTVVRHHDLADALAAVVAGKPVPVPRTEAVGCIIE